MRRSDSAHAHEVAPSDRLVSMWGRYGKAVTGVGVAYLVVAAAGKLAYALPHLVRDIAPWSAVDLKYRHNEVMEWFAGHPVYGVVDGAVYPPASYVILWPFLGWLPLDPARILWALTTLVAATLIALLAYRVGRPAPPLQRLVVAGLAFAAYPIQMTVFAGQLGVHVAALVFMGAFLLIEVRSSGWSDTLAALLLAGSLVKPTLSAPLVLAALVISGRLRPPLLTISCYFLLTAGAAWAQPGDLVTLLRDWVAVTEVRVSFMEGVPGVHLLLTWLGFDAWRTEASLFLLAALAAGLWPCRRIDPWVLLGAAAIVARFWSHSRAYDDTVLLFVPLALLRVATLAEGSVRWVAGALLAASWVALLTPTWAFLDLPTVAIGLLHTGHTVLWLAAFTLIVALAYRRPTAPYML